MKRILVTLLLLTGLILSGRAQKTMNDLEPLPPGYKYAYDFIVEPWISDHDGYYYPFFWAGFVIKTPMHVVVDISESEYMSHVFFTLMDRHYNVLETAPLKNLETYQQYSTWLLPGTYIMKCEIMKRYNTKQGCLRFHMTTSFLDTALEPEPLPEPNPHRRLTEPVFQEKDTLTHHTYIDVQTMLSANNDSSRIVRSCYDGLGREVKTIRKRSTPGGQDLWVSKEYDASGRVYKEWLPQTTGWSYTDSRPYKFTCHESVPLESPLAHFGAGEAWNSAPVSSDALINNTSERLSCAYYLVGKDTLYYGGVYATGELNVVRTVDEDSLVRYNFTDKAGQLVLSRQMDGEDRYDTYYVYDGKRNLRFVLPPAIPEGDVSFESLDRYAYQYKYDLWGNRIWEKKPGCDSLIYAYDKVQKLIYSQDGNQRKNGQYTFYLYDIMGREVVKGICTSPQLEFLSWKKCISERVQDGGVLFSGYSKGDMNMTPVKLLTVNYYDNYDFLDSSVFAAKKSALTYVSIPGYDERYVNKEHPGISERGLLTGTCVYTLGEDGDTPVLTTMYYDSKGRVVQRRTIDHREGVDTHCFHYTFTGKTLQQLHVREENGNQTFKEVSYYTYDSEERLLQVKHQLNDGEITVLSAKEYDELCRLKRNILNNGKHPVEYAYNIRNWLTDIKSPLFTQTLHYNDGTSIPYWGGNISSMTWQTGTGALQGYQFSYDGLSRLKDAVYGEGIGLSANQNCFNEQVTAYDRMGNILKLKRYGQISEGSYGMIDDLSFTYDGNQLSSVNDNATDSVSNNGFEFKDGATESIEYLYDANGNLIQDLNKNIVDIEYNFLNLPRCIKFADGNRISYVYDALGNKLRTVHVINGDSTVTDYCGNVIYENGVAKTLLVEEGYVSLNDTTYHYFIQDHQGNNRVVANQDGTIEEVNHYYPFGGTFANSTSVQPYKYNGKELDRKNGLDWYDYGARHYDAALGRWNAVDPMAEKYYGWSPYAYCAGNPLKYIDLKGDSISVADLYARDKQGELINPNQVEVFEFLVNTKEGKKLLGNYAAKGQTITGVSFDKDGKFHSQGVNISFGTDVRDSSVSGTTTFSVDDKNLNIQVVVGNSSDKSDLLDTFIHETAIHADQNSVDFSDDKKMNNSNAYPALRKMNGKRGYTQHWQERNVNRAMERIGVPIIQQYYKSKGISKPKNAILKSVYGFIN